MRRTLDETTAEQMIEATARGAGRARDPGDRKIEIEVEDVYGAIASATVRSAVTGSTSTSCVRLTVGRSSMRSGTGRVATLDEA